MSILTEHIRFTVLAAQFKIEVTFHNHVATMFSPLPYHVPNKHIPVITSIILQFNNFSTLKHFLRLTYKHLGSFMGDMGYYFSKNSNLYNDFGLSSKIGK